VTAHGSPSRDRVGEAVDFCVTTFKRPRAVERLLLSIAAYYPQANIFVADQNEVFDAAFYERLRTRLAAAGLRTPPRVERLDHDCGVSAARNHLVSRAPREYKLILEDDFVFTERTAIESFVDLLDGHPGVGIVGGAVYRDGEEARFDFKIDVRDGTFRAVCDDGPFDRHAATRYRRTDSVVNFALMRGELLRHTCWDPRLKVAEHEDFYLRVRETHWGVIYTPDVAVDHPDAEADPGYTAYRVRAEFIVASMYKHGLTRVETINGLVAELHPDRLVLRPGDGSAEIVHAHRGADGVGDGS
jgi:GT2 family glycosyltransferase